jgi:hypothetical protein
MTFHETLALVVCLIGGFAALVWLAVWLARPKKCQHLSRTWRYGDGGHECEACGEIVWSDAE